MKNETKNILVELEAELSAEYPVVWKEIKNKTYEKKVQVIEEYIKTYTNVLNEDEETMKAVPPCFAKDDEALKQAISLLTKLKKIYSDETNPKIMKFETSMEKDEQAELDKLEKQFISEHKETWIKIENKSYEYKTRVVYKMHKVYSEVAEKINENIKKTNNEDLLELKFKQVIALRLSVLCQRLADLYFEKAHEERVEFLLNETNSQMLERGADHTERFLSIGLSIETINALIQTMNKNNFDEIKPMLLCLCDRTRTKAQSLRDDLLEDENTKED